MEDAFAMNLDNMSNSTTSGLLCGFSGTNSLYLQAYHRHICAQAATEVGGVGAGPPDPLYTETVEYSCGVQQVRFKPWLRKATVSLSPFKGG